MNIMQYLPKLYLILFLILVFIFGCNSSDLSKKEGKVSKENIDYSVSEGDYINVKSSKTDNTKTYTKNILIPLEKIDGCDYLVQGKIVYIKNGAVVATVDFGDGQCDNIATKTVDGVDHEIKLNKKGKKPKKQVVFTLILQIFIFKNTQESFFCYSLPNQRHDIKKLIKFEIQVRNYS